MGSETVAYVCTNCFILIHIPINKHIKIYYLGRIYHQLKSYIKFRAIGIIKIVSKPAKKYCSNIYFYIEFSKMYTFTYVFYMPGKDRYMIYFLGYFYFCRWLDLQYFYCIVKPKAPCRVTLFYLCYTPFYFVITILQTQNIT